MDSCREILSYAVVQKESPMNISEIMDQIHKAERTFPVNEWSYRGIDLWPILRSKLYFELFFKHNFEILGHSPSFLPKALETLKDIAISVPAFAQSILPVITAEKHDIIFLADPSYTKWDGKFYHRFIDPEIEWLKENGKSAITLTINSMAYKPPTNRTLDVFMPSVVIRIIGTLYGKVQKKPGLLPQFDSYNDYLEKLGLERISDEKLTAIGIKYWLTSKFYQFFLKRISPKAAFVVSYYESFNMAFVHACKTLKIPVIDIQHGGINNFHASYGGWSRIPAIGYNTLPDYFSCWDRHSADCINEWASRTNGKHAPIVHGNRFMKKVLDQQNRFKPLFETVQNERSPAHNILLTLQTCYEITPFLEKMLRASPENYFWWVRFHPMLSEEAINGMKGKLASFKNLQYETEKSTAHSLYEILPLMDSHVTLNSSVVIEAAQMGVPSVVCEETGYIYYRAEFESGDAHQALTPEDAIKLIADIRKNTERIEFPVADALYKIIGVV